MWILKCVFGFYHTIQIQCFYFEHWKIYEKQIWFLRYKYGFWNTNMAFEIQISKTTFKWGKPYTGFVNVVFKLPDVGFENQMCVSKTKCGFQ